MKSSFRIDFEKYKPLPVGNSGWADFSQKCYTVDKTLLIKDLIDDQTTVALFTRPRRFGKTTALQMLKAFFEKAPKDTSFLFKNKLIWKAGAKYRAEQGRYPVIYLTFKDIDGETFADAFESVRMCVSSMVADHQESIEALPKEADRKRLRCVMEEEGSVKDFGAALGLLAQAVHRHAEKSLKKGEDPVHAKPIILIDEYDLPVNKASVNGYLKKMTTFMRQFLSGAMKDNNHVRMGIMTGVLRVAKEGILSGLNNPKVWTVFSKRYSQYFGFTEDEVRAMTRFYGVPEKMSEIKDWYDGYYFGGMEIYNPWSVLGYFDNDCEAKPYWLDTSSNDLITEIVRDLPHDTDETLEQLLRDGRARVPMTEELGPYAEIRNRPETLYALLVSSGYLKTVSPGEGDVLPQKMAYVAIPNREVQMVFINDIIDKVRRFTGKSESNDIALAIYDRDPQTFRDAIQRFLTASVSYFDNSEAFYHGMTLGFLAVLRDRYKVESNCESGEGRFDIALTPLIPDFPGVIVEVKAAKNKAANLKRLAKAARKQIDAKDYAAKMTSAGVTDILKLGLAYYKKKVEVAS